MIPGGLGLEFSLNVYLLRAELDLWRFLSHTGNHTLSELSHRTFLICESLEPEVHVFPSALL